MRYILALSVLACLAASPAFAWGTGAGTGSSTGTGTGAATGTGTGAATGTGSSGVGTGSGGDHGESDARGFVGSDTEALRNLELGCVGNNPRCK